MITLINSIVCRHCVPNIVCRCRRLDVLYFLAEALLPLVRNLTVQAALRPNFQAT